MKKGKVNLMNLHISNIEMGNILLDTAEAFITNLLDNLDEVTKYSFAVELIARLDNLTQECYDSADETSQTIIDYLENTGWNYDELPSYTEYSRMMKKYLYNSECELPDETVYTDEGCTEDVANAFGIKTVNTGLTTDSAITGQLRFPNDYENEEALAKGMVQLPISVFPPFTQDGKPPVKPAPVNDPAEDRKKARAAYLAAMKQQNTSQPT